MDGEYTGGLLPCLSFESRCSIIKYNPLVAQYCLMGFTRTYLVPFWVQELAATIVAHCIGNGALVLLFPNRQGAVTSEVVMP